MTKSYIKLIFLFLFGLIHLQAVSQIKLIRSDSIPILIGTDTLTNPWAGGLNSPQFSNVDLNGDGIKDLVLFERNFYGVVKPFVNNGLADDPAFVYAPFYRSAFPPMSNWALLVDYNCDGKEDIFTDVPFGATVYRNDSDPVSGLKFTRVTSLLKTSTPEGEEILYVASPDIPAITDVDNDGDQDILVFGILGSTVEYHKNMSVENYGDCDHLEFELKNRCWGYFSENDNTNGITLFDTCPENVPDPEKDNRHAGSTVLALDLNGDMVKDLVLGDLTYNNLVMLMNGGTLNNSSMIAYDSAFPSNTVSADLTIFPASFHLDVDNDGRNDIIVTPNNPVRSENINNIWYYQNKGTDQIPEFVFQTDQFLQNEMVDVGAGARPVFFDYNGDELMDIVVGNFGYFIETSVYDSKLALYENTGSPSRPSYQFITDDYSSLSTFQIPGIYPCFGDLNNDGVLEMLVGDEEGRLHLFKDFSGEGEPADFTLTVPNFNSIDVGETAMPQIVDINQDGKQDLLVGERGGTINYFENIGTPEESDFNTVPTNDFFGEIDMMVECCTGYSSPYLSKDSLDQSILYVGSEKGWLYLYDNIDGNLEGAFRLLDSLNLFGLKVTVSGGDITNDGSEEITYGEFAGGICIMKYGIPSFLDIIEFEESSHDFSIYPNPAANHLNIKFKGLVTDTKIYCNIVDLYGKVLISQRNLNPALVNTIDISQLKAGIYFLRIDSGNQRITKKVIVL